MASEQNMAEAAPEVEPMAATASGSYGPGKGSGLPVRYTHTTSPVAKRLYPDYSRARSSPPPHAAAAGTTESSATRKIRTVSDRLVTPKKVRTLPPIDRGPHLAPDAQQNLCERLYSRSVEKMKLKMDKQDALLKKNDTANKALSLEQQEEMVQRMYYSQRKHDASVANELAKKYISQPTNVLKLSKDELEEYNKRLYYDRKEAKKQTYQKLYDQYITQTNPVFPKLSQDAQSAMANRLHTKASG
eukprot:RCo047318